jgi:small subunit ribosomal protein S13
MPRISGIDIPDNKIASISLTYIYGLGRSNVKKILESAGVNGQKRAKDLTEEEVSKIQKLIDTVKVEGDLREEVQNNIKRLKEIGSYRGSRHIKNLPSRGQRTRSNARTKRGKRVTIGTVRKEVVQKTGGPTAPAPAAAPEKGNK